MKLILKHWFFLKKEWDILNCFLILYFNSRHWNWFSFSIGFANRSSFIQPKHHNIPTPSCLHFPRKLHTVVTRLPWTAFFSGGRWWWGEHHLFLRLLKHCGIRSMHTLRGWYWSFRLGKSSLRRVSFTSSHYVPSPRRLPLGFIICCLPLVHCPLMERSCLHWETE